MTYRPYPNADRARHQIERHDDEAPPQAQVGERRMSPLERQFFLAVAEAGGKLRPQLEAIGESLLAAFRPHPVSDKEQTA